MSSQTRCFLSTITPLHSQPFIVSTPIFRWPKRRRIRVKIPSVFSLLKNPPSVNEVASDDIMQAFLKERELSGDIIAKLCDRIWLRGEPLYVHDNADVTTQITQEEEKKGLEEENEGGFLQLRRTNEWLMGNSEPPVNRKLTLKEITDNREKIKRLNLLKYEALKRELLMLTVAIGTACSGYCLVVFSVEAALSYATGVLFSCLYLQLLCQQADNLSKEAVPQIFMQKKTKKIGIRSQDLQNTFERTIKGSGIALSSPRLVIPAIIYGLWELSQNFTHDIFDFQLVPAMVGIFAYKAAALVQVYRDNEDLQLIFPGDEKD